MRTSKNYIFIHYYSNGVSHYYLHLAEIQRPSRKFKSFQVERREGFRYALIRSCWYEEVGEELTRSRVPYGIDQEHIWFSLDSPKFEARKKIREAGSYCSSSAIWDRLLQKVVGQSSIFIYGLAIVHLYIHFLTDLHVSLLNYFWRPLGSSVS